MSYSIKGCLYNQDGHAGSQGKSMAMAVESRVIAALRERGFALISDHDARRHSAPTVAQHAA